MVLKQKRHILRQGMLQANVACLANVGDIQLWPDSRQAKDSTDVLVCQCFFGFLMAVAKSGKGGSEE
jgi:hypothetical protein